MRIMKKQLPVDAQTIENITKKFPTPFHLYDEFGMVENVKNLQKAFSWNTGFREYYAVKAAPNPFLMKILADAGLAMDCSSLAELELAEMCGIRGMDIMFSSNNTPLSEYQKAIELGAIVNLDDITHIEFLEKELGLPELLCFRYNPGPAAGGNGIIGKPEEAKFGLTLEQMYSAYEMAQKKGVKRFGIHTMPCSNELNSEYFVTTAKLLSAIATEARARFGIEVEFMNIGGGFGIPYRPGDKPLDLEAIGQGIRAVFEENFTKKGLAQPKLFLECGRIITGPYGMLVTKAVHSKDTYRKYVGVDASMQNLMRPGMYGAYHHISVLGKEDSPEREVYDVVGSLCENNDKFAVQRELPKIERGDILVIHDAGAHGHAMGFNYNGKLRSAELLLRKDGSVLQIRRAETLDDLFATLDRNALRTFQA